MNDTDKTKEQLIDEIASLRNRLAASEAMKRKRGSDDGDIQWRLLTDSGAVGDWSIEEQMLFAKFSVEVAADEVFWMRDDSKIIYVNDSACKRLGYSRDEMLEMYVWDWDPLFPKEVWPGFWKELQEKKSKVFETKHRTKAGDIFPVEIAARIFEYSGREYLFAFVKDITEAKKAEEELKRYRDHLEDLVEERTAELAIAKEAAEAANHAKSQFLANMSHELRTPLNAIIGFSEILENLIVEPKQKSYIKRVLTSGNALLTLINDILDFSKIEAGKLELSHTPCSIRRMFAEIKDIFDHKMIQKGLDIVLELDSEIPAALLLDELRIRQVILNLLGNAVKFTQTGSIILAARTESVQGGVTSSQRFILSVTDTGIGISEDQISNIFDAFEQQKGQNASQYGGTGLGLTITRRLVEAMNGRISVSSRLGAGSTFTVVLEDVEVVVVENAEIRETDLFDFEAIRFDKATVLVVDDIGYNRDLLKGFLDGCELALLEAENGHEAIEKARRYRPDLILLDMKMPVMDGYEASMILKDDPVLKTIPVVAVTASALQQDEQRIRRICDGYLRKPLTRAELIKESMKYLSHTVQAATVPEKVPDTELGQVEAVERVVRLPRAIVARLNQAITLGDMDELIGLVDGIYKSDARLAQYMSERVKQYRFEEIVSLLENRGS